MLTMTLQGKLFSPLYVKQLRLREDKQLPGFLSKWQSGIWTWVFHVKAQTFHVAGLCRAYTKVSLDWEKTQATGPPVCVHRFCLTHLVRHCVMDEHFVYLSFVWGFGVTEEKPLLIQQNF